MFDCYILALKPTSLGQCMTNTGKSQLVTKEIKPNQECISVRASNCNTTMYTGKNPTHLLCIEKGRWEV